MTVIWSTEFDDGSTKEKLENIKGATYGDIKCGVCPLAIIPDEFFDLIDLYSHCSDFNALPRPGGLLDQDNKTLEAFSVIRGEMAKIQEERMNEARRGTKA